MEEVVSSIRGVSHRGPGRQPPGRTRARAPSAPVNSPSGRKEACAPTRAVTLAEDLDEEGVVPERGARVEDVGPSAGRPSFGGRGEGDGDLPGEEGDVLADEPEESVRDVVGSRLEGLAEIRRRQVGHQGDASGPVEVADEEVDASPVAGRSEGDEAVVVVRSEEEAAEAPERPSTESGPAHSGHGPVFVHPENRRPRAEADEEVG